MTRTNNFKLAAILFTLIATLVAIMAGPSLLKAATSYVTSQTSAAATTTVSYMTPGTATTTYQIDNLALNKVQEMGEVDAITVLVQFAASTTASTLNVQQQVSNNNIDWYTVNQVVGTPTSLGSSTLATSSITYQWTPGVAGTSSTAFVILNVPARHERLVFSNTGASGAIYNEVTLKRLPTTP